MAIYRTAQGKRIDMSTLAAKNERVRAVGNMSVNARGDTIDSHGRIIVPVTKKVGDKYKRTVSNKAANLAKHKADSMKPIETAPSSNMKIDVAEEIELLAEEQEIDDLAEFEIEIEELKAAENKKK